MILFFSSVGLLDAADVPQGATVGVEAANLDKQIPHEDKVKGVWQGLYSCVQCVKIIDADTIEIANGETVRLIGVGVLPERRVAAIDCLRNILENKNVRLEFDVEPKDKTGNLLAYVFVTVYPGSLNVEEALVKLDHEVIFESLDPEGIYQIFINTYLVKNGFVVAKESSPNVKYAGLFRSAASAGDAR